MPEAQAAEGGGQARQGGSSVLSTAFRLFLVYMVVRNLFGGGKQAPPPGMSYKPSVSRGDPMSMRVFISEQPEFVVDDLDAVSTAPVWQQLDFSLPLAAERTHTITYRPSKAVQNNGTLYMHTVFEATVFAKTEADVLGSTQTLQWIRSWPITEYLPAPKVVEGVNLLSGKNEDGQHTTQEAQRAAASAPRDIVSYIKPNLTISLVDEQSVLVPSQLQPQQQPWIHLDDDMKTYLPTVFFNDFWTLRDYMVPVNQTVSELELQLTLNSIGPWKWMMYLQMEQSFSMQKTMGAMAEGDTDEFKRVLLEGNPIFLGLTFCVSLLHSVFDMLAFKNDIGFWKEKKTMEGLSVKTIFINCVCQVIIFLYLLDNDTSFIILASTFVGILIEFWKITKAMDVTIDRSGPYPRVSFKNRESYQKSRTQEYDAQAMRYLSYVLYPLVLGYAVYSLVYKPHKSWYSWVLNTAVGSVYLFGFILMCPQLYLNYRLKSVAHLPWRQMSYKFLNTIIDDLFAFVIKMPTLHRLSVFRDDLVFLVYLYQRWIYPIDKTRANEFGYTEAAAEAEPPRVEAAPATPAAPPSDSSDDFEDLGKDEDTLQLRQRRGGNGSSSGGNGSGGNGSGRRGDKSVAAGAAASGNKKVH